MTPELQTQLRKLEADAFLARAETLAILVAHPAYLTYTDILREMRVAALEQLAVAQASDVGFWQGVVATIANILDRPPQVIGLAAELQRAEEESENVIRPDLRAILGMGVNHDETL